MASTASATLDPSLIASDLPSQKAHRIVYRTCWSAGKRHTALKAAATVGEHVPAEADNGPEGTAPPSRRPPRRGWEVAGDARSDYPALTSLPRGPASTEKVGLASGFFRARAAAWGPSSIRRPARGL